MATVNNPGRVALATATAGDGNGDVVTLNAGYPYIEVTVRTDAGAATGFVRFTVDTGPNDEQQQTPTLAGPNGYYVAYGATRTVRDDAYGSPARAGVAPNSVIRIVASAAVAYVVTGIDVP